MCDWCQSMLIAFLDFIKYDKTIMNLKTLPLEKVESNIKMQIINIIFIKILMMASC